MQAWQEISAGVVATEKGLAPVLKDCLKLVGIGRVLIIGDPFERETRPLVRDCDLLVGALTETGLSLVHRLRRDANSPNTHIPILLVAVDVTAPDVQAAIGFGANDVLLLPINGKTMRQRLTHAVLVGRPFITTASYVGPCRRRALTNTVWQGRERRANAAADLAGRQAAAARAQAMAASEEAEGWRV